MELIGFITAWGVGIVMGMYVSSQIMHSIDRNINRKKFIKNLNKKK